MRATQSVNGDLGEREPNLPERLDAIHARICGDDSADKRYVNGLSNAAKAQYICKAIGYPQGVFNIEVPFPIEDWLISDDQSLICSGLYLNDLRCQFYAGVEAEMPEQKERVWPKAGEAEFWQHAFNTTMQKRQVGRLLDDYRVLH